MIHFFRGEYQGNQFVGARVTDPNRKMTAVAAVDALSNRYGPKLPELNERDCVIRPVASDVLPPSVEMRLGGVSQAVVHDIGRVTLEELEPFFTPTEINQAFKTPAEIAAEEATRQKASAAA